VGRLGLEFNPYVTQVRQQLLLVSNLYQLFVCFVGRLGLEFNPYVTQVSAATAAACFESV
jgi:adenylosuccinate lyase